jgi:hypothetical protein
MQQHKRLEAALPAAGLARGAQQLIPHGGTLQERAELGGIEQQQGCPHLGQALCCLGIDAGGKEHAHRGGLHGAPLVAVGGARRFLVHLCCRSLCRQNARMLA